MYSRAGELIYILDLIDSTQCLPRLGGLEAVPSLATLTSPKLFYTAALAVKKCKRKLPRSDSSHLTTQAGNSINRYDGTEYTLRRAQFERELTTMTVRDACTPPALCRSMLLRFETFGNSS
ncbi:hypothetical protein ElyMa_002230400 [Elysia marginata]|uniref:Uncharacterized protein n=1 Tax=Elysia marginata TaxID=1093978 RepID=A0AAV4FWN7_9GAST|nr:hypothetical protein ElyMa_002230400 [Elysia marginata]